MNRNEIELLAAPGGGRDLEQVRQAAAEIERAQAACLAAYDATMPAVKKAAEVSSDEINASQSPLARPGVIQRRIEAALYEFNTKALPVFLRARAEAAGRACLACEERKRVIDAEAEQRVSRLGVALGKLLGDKGAGADLAALFVRAGGGFPDLADRLRLAADARNAWHACVKHAVGAARAADAAAATLADTGPAPMGRTEAIEKFVNMTEDRA